MRLALFALTRGALELAKRVKNSYTQADLFTLPRWQYEPAISIAGKLSDFLPGIFHAYDIHLFIMASGIVVRLIAPLLQDKTSDPGVLVADEKGSFVISLVSGHIGGANSAAREIARVLGAVPVITTASDVRGTLAVDQLAVQYGLTIDHMERAKQITALIVNGEPVNITAEIPIEKVPGIDSTREHAAGLILISSRILRDPGKPWVQLIPRTLIAGVGCRKGCSAGQIMDTIRNACERAGRRIEGLKTIASVELKACEPGLIEAAALFQTRLVFYTVEQIKTVEHMFPSSEFVKKTIGAGGVCEPAAYLAAEGKGRMLLSKQSSQGVTVALWEEDYIL